MLKINDSLLEDYQRLVYSIINKYSNNSNKEDLYQVGMIGLLEASKKYNESEGVKFTSYAYKYILGEILKYLREDRNIRVSRDIIKDYRKIMIAKDYIYKTYGKELDDKELSRMINIPESRIREVLNYNNKELSLNRVVDEEGKITLEDTIIDNRDDFDMISLKSALSILNVDEKKLIYERYFQNKSQTELAKENKTSQVKIYRYERKILDKLKDKMT